MGYIPDREIVLSGTLLDVLQSVSELMLTPNSAREFLPSLQVESVGISVDCWLALWFPADSALLISALTADELALKVECVFHTRTANVYIELQDTDRRLGFLTTQQAIPLFDRWHLGESA